LGAVGCGGDDGLQLGHGDPTVFGHPGRPEASEQRVHRRPDDIAGDQVAGRLGGGAAVGGDVGDAGVVGQLLEHRRRELGRRDDAQVEHASRPLPAGCSTVDPDQKLGSSGWTFQGRTPAGSRATPRRPQSASMCWRDRPAVRRRRPWFKGPQHVLVLQQVAAGHALEGSGLARVVQVARQVVEGPVLECHRHDVVEPVRAVVSSHDQPPSRVEQRAFRPDPSIPAEAAGQHRPATQPASPLAQLSWHHSLPPAAHRSHPPIRMRCPARARLQRHTARLGASLGGNWNCSPSDGGPSGVQHEGRPAHDHGRNLNSGQDILLAQSSCP
jgi:hypothetical protein